MRDVVELPAGWLVLQDHDRAARRIALDPESGKAARLRPGWVPAPGPAGWYAVRQRRLLALYRHGDRITYRCGRGVWDVHDATVTATCVGPLHRLRFWSPSTPVRRCAYLDSELARRWLLPPPLDPTPMAEDEDFDWSLFVRNVMGDPERRTRIGRTSPAVADPP